MLEKLHVQAHAAADGVEALEILARESYDLILMDCLMPRMDGYEATRKIRAMKSDVSGIPIVAVTANTMKGDRERCFEVGMNDYLAKPVSRGALAKMLEKWLPRPERVGGLLSEEPPSEAPVCDESATPEGIVWDRAVLLHRLDGDEDLTEEIAAEFLEDIPDEFAALSAALASGDLASAGRHAHTIKGTSASVGGEALRAVAFETEKAAKAEDAEAASSAFHKMELEFGRLKKEMEKGL
jgi:CheY-like chemotaxis protein/HPt (histidine-containing phosphotransfer) domain-containing protein